MVFADTLAYLRAPTGGDARRDFSDLAERVAVVLDETATVLAALSGRYDAPVPAEAVEAFERWDDLIVDILVRTNVSDAVGGLHEVQITLRHVNRGAREASSD